MSKSIDEVIMIPPEKRPRHDNEENQDRLSDLPDCVLLHILSFFNSKHAVQTCVLSTRWKYLWKRIHTLILHSTDFSTLKKFAIFVSKMLTLRGDTSTTLLDLYHCGDIEPQLLKNILNYVSSRNTHLQEVRISLDTPLIMIWDDSCRAQARALASLGDTRGLIMSCVSSCQALTSLKLSLYPPPLYHRDSDNYTETFPKSLNLPLLTSLDLTNFTFCGGGNGCAEPFSPFTKLNSLVIRSCKVKDARILRISSETLVNLSMYDYSSDLSKVELSTPSLCTFTFPKSIDKKISGSGLSSVKQVNINAEESAPTTAVYMERALVLLSWLQDLANVESLTVTSITLQILSLVPDLFKVKFSSLCNMKYLKVELIPYAYGGGLPLLMEKEMLKKAAAKSRQEAAKLRKAFKEGLKPPPIHDGIIDFLRQNSPSTEVNIITKYPSLFNLKQVEESIKGWKNTSYHLQFPTPAASSVVPASAAESASATAPASTAPPNLHLCHTEKWQGSNLPLLLTDHHSNSQILTKKITTQSPLPGTYGLYRVMSKSIDEVIMIPPEKKPRHDNEENQDRLNNLPDCVLLHILSFFNSKHAVQTCVLSTRWKYLWKRIHTLILHSTDFSTLKKFAIFVSKILTLRGDTSTVFLDLHHCGDIEPQLLKNILNYISSHNTHLQEVRISLDTPFIMSWDSSCRAWDLTSRSDNLGLIISHVSSCQALTSLKLSLYPPPRNSIGKENYTETFPKSLNLPLLTSLDLTNFTFCGGENGCAEPFSAFTKLNSLVIRSCRVKDAQILRISSETLVNLSMYDYSKYDYSSNVAEVELSTPSLCTFTFPKNTNQKICGSGLSSVKQVNINAQESAPTFGALRERALVLLSWLQDLANVESLTVTSITLQILSLVPDLFKVKLSSLCNMKSLKVELIPYAYGGGLPSLMEKEMLKKAAAKSRQEAAKLRKAYKAGLKPPPIPDGIIDFLRQNSPSTEVNIITKYPSRFNLKQVEESIKGEKNTSYHSQFATPTASSALPASAAESASATAPASNAPPNLHLCHTEKMTTNIDNDDSTLWPDLVTKAFIDIMVDEVTKGNMTNGMFYTETWTSMTTRLNSITNCSYEKEQLGAKFHRLQAMFLEFYSLLQNTGFRWNAETNTVTASEEVWQNYLKAHDKASQFQKKGCDHYKLLEIIFNKNNGTEVLDQPNTNTENELNNQYLNTESTNNACVDNDSSDNDIQVECIIRRGKQEIQVKYHTPRTESTSNRMGDALVAQAKIVEASSSHVTEDCSLTKCVVALEEIRDISDDIFGKALEKFKDPDWREMFIAMSNDRRRGWVLRL